MIGGPFYVQIMNDYSSFASTSTTVMELNLNNDNTTDFFSNSILDSQPLDSDFFNSFADDFDDRANT